MLARSAIAVALVCAACTVSTHAACPYMTAQRWAREGGGSRSLFLGQAPKHCSLRSEQSSAREALTPAVTACARHLTCRKLQQVPAAAPVTIEAVAPASYSEAAAKAVRGWQHRPTAAMCLCCSCCCCCCTCLTLVTSLRPAWTALARSGVRSTMHTMPLIWQTLAVALLALAQPPRPIKQRPRLPPLTCTCRSTTPP